MRALTWPLSVCHSWPHVLVCCLSRTGHSGLLPSHQHGLWFPGKSQICPTGGLEITQLVKNPPAMQETQFDSWVRKIHWRRDRLLTPVFWPGDFHGLYSTWGHQEMDATEQLSLSENSYCCLRLYICNRSLDCFFNIHRGMYNAVAWVIYEVKSRVRICLD